MCLAIPGKLLSIDGDHGMADFDGTQKRIVVALLPRAKVGSYVIVHAGYAIQEVDEQAAMESISIWREMLAKDMIDKNDYV